ncbi:MAG: nucleotidyltransferase domain-containing protein [Candidatus Thorarchaeota archaeon]|nr:nucleotidyltransferase domain-containing protein [Candidatus Thorarchaeota archaeon]
MNIEAITEALKRADHVIFVYIFESVARGQTHPLSDLDIAVFLDKYNVDEFLEILNNNADIVECKVDLVVLNDASPLLRHRVVSEGILLFSKNKELTIQFYTDALIEGLDFKESYELYKQEVREHLGSY